MDTTPVPLAPAERVTHASPPEAKIQLFRSLFRGREDVYPRRFENRRTGKSGYSPACANEWIRGICEKPRIKCTDCPHKRFLPVTQDTVRQHLSGWDASGSSFVMGCYPMLLDESCHFLAADFDGANWQEDVRAVLAVCDSLEVPVALERSRSGAGGHVWLFFEEAVPAILARKLGCHLVTEAMESRPELGLKSYDRLFPNQDTLPRGGFGNLIALPLQKAPRELGNSVFLDPVTMKPHRDQWAFLASIRRIRQPDAERWVREADSRGRIVGVRLLEPEPDAEERTPWTAPPSRRTKEQKIVGPIPKQIEVILGDQVYLAKDGLPPALRNRLIRLAAFQNPEFYRAQAMRLPTHDKPRVIGCAEDHPDHIGLPRGCLDEILTLFASLEVEGKIRDERFPGKPLDVKFHGDLRPDQLPAAEALAAHDFGILDATTAFGKTVVGAWLIAARRVNTLVLVHRQQLLDQWVERLSTFLGVPAKAIGQLGSGRKRLTGNLDVAIIQSLVRKGVVDDRIGDYGFVIVDECHHVSAPSVELLARRAKARFVTGLSATLARKDGHHPIILMQCGPVRHRVDARSQAAARPFTHRVIVRPTHFRAAPSNEADARFQFHELYDGLSRDDRRNRMICADVATELADGRRPLVLTERTDHLERLAELLKPSSAELIVLRGGLGRRELRDTLQHLRELSNSTPRIVLATGRFIGEGFDDPALDTLFVTLPVSWRGIVAQYVGRLHRLHEGKREARVYDYADLGVPMLERMFDRRCRGYEAVGYSIVLPGSAVAGWPADVPLPVDPTWNQDHAATVRRLIQDGLDNSLARLFVDATVRVGPIPEGDEGVERARSATEAFVFRRLETLPATAGRFQLNVRLPIPFDGSGHMEVDLLAAESRLVVELDGAQHLGDADAYRRDRRKDSLLQENGYHVLRFLAQDVGSRLDELIDAILRALAHRRARQ